MLALIILCGLTSLACSGRNAAEPEVGVLPEQFKDRFADVVAAVSENPPEGLTGFEGASSTCTEGFKRVDPRSSLGFCGFEYPQRGESAPPASSVNQVRFAAFLWPNVDSAQADWKIMKGTDEQPFFLNPAGIGEESFIRVSTGTGGSCRLMQLQALSGVATLVAWAEYCAEPPTEDLLQIARLLLTVKP